MDKRFTYKSNVYDKNGRRRQNLISEKIPTKRERNNPAGKDAENRKHVVEEIERLVSTGISVEEACESLVDSNKDKFKYFPEGMNLAQIFARWYSGKIREKRNIEKGNYYDRAD